MRALKTFTLLTAFSLVAACASTGANAGSPDQVAAEIVRALDDQRVDEASDIFEDVAELEDHRQQIYPLLYEAAQDRYTRGDAAGATALLSFMSEEYPRAQAVERALLYSLFLLRGQQGSTSPELTGEMQSALKAVRSQSRPPVWTDLVETQLLIDQGRLAEAMDAFQRFHSAWDGQPEAIAVYVEDIERYLASH